MTRQGWLEARKRGIGASEASAILGLNPYKTNTELWEEKTGRREIKDISDKPYVKYGTEAEKPLRELFTLDFPQHEVKYEEFDMRYHPNYPFIFATLDGDLTEIETGRKGILEIKTSEIMRNAQFENWNGKIPDNYYTQICHQLLATGYEFAVLKAQLKTNYYSEVRLRTQHYFIERSDIQNDIDYLLRKEIEFWKCVEEDRRPNLILPEI